MDTKRQIRVHLTAKQLGVPEENIEFVEGEEVTFQAYDSNEPVKLIVGCVTRGSRMTCRPDDDRVLYHCSRDGKYPYTNITTGKSIKESKLFNLTSL